VPVRRSDHRRARHAAATRTAATRAAAPALAAALALGLSLPADVLAQAAGQSPNPSPSPAAAPALNPAAPPAVQGPVPPVGSPSAALPAAGPSAAAASRTANRASAILMDQATYWSAQGRPELAQQALERLLLVEPNNPEALAVAAEVAALNGDRAQAEAYAERVTQLAPGSAAATRAAGALRIASVDQAILSDARRLAQAGQREASIQRYREIFPDGNVPDIYAAEYYQTYATVSLSNFLEARRAMEAVLGRNPENRPLQLAFAQMLATRETTRGEAIDILRQLAQSPDVAGGARAAWRQAILWQGPNTETLIQVEEYLRVFPGDPEILAKLEESRPRPLDRQSARRKEAYDALPQNPREAERLFSEAVAENPNDVDSIVGLGIVRRRERRDAEAKVLFDRAMEIAPERREEMLRAFGYVDRDGVPYPEPGSNAGRVASGSRGPAQRGRDAGARSNQPGTGLSLRGWQAFQRGRLDEAQSLGQQLARGTPAEQADAANLLGQVAVRRNDFGTAELRFRESLSRRPGQADVQAALYGAMVQQGRLEEADRFARASGYRPSGDAQAARSEQLRGQAQRQEATDQRIETLRSAVAAQPTNVWASHDLARALKTVGQQSEARQVERDLIRQGTRDATYASALLSEYDGRVGETVQRLEAIPSGSRTADMNTMLDRNRRQLEVRQLEVAARGNPRSAAAQRLVALAGQPDATGSTQAEVIRIFNRLRQPENLEAARRAASGDSTPAPAKAAIAAALVDAGREGAAENLAQRAERDPRLAEDLRRTATAAPAGPRTAARPAGSGAGAAAEAVPATRDPESWRAQLSLARVYARSDRGADATEVAEGVLRQNPDNVEARSVAGEIAVVRGQIGRAEQILSEGRTRRADELQMALLEARIARARDDQVRARRALEDAARLRGQQLRAANP